MWTTQLRAAATWPIEVSVRPRRAVTLCALFLAAAACSPTPDAGDAVMASLEALPSIQAMKTHYPDDYRRLEGRVREAALRDAPDDVGRAVQETLGPVLGRQRPKADAETSVGLYEVTRAEAGALRKVDPNACVAFMEGRGATAPYAKSFDEDLRMRDFKATARLLTQTATNPAAPSQPMSFDELLKLSTEALNTLPDADQDVALRVLREEREPRTVEEARVICDFDLALADAILSRPRPIAGAMIRRMWAAQ